MYTIFITLNEMGVVKGQVASDPSQDKKVKAQYCMYVHTYNIWTKHQELQHSTELWYTNFRQPDQQLKRQNNARIGLIKIGINQSRTIADIVN